MKQNLSGGVVVIIILIAVVIIGFFGFRYVSGGPNADITQSRIQYYREKAAKSAGNGNALPLSAPISRGGPAPRAATGTH
jgi:hypothetical protein